MKRTILVIENDPEERQIFSTYLRFAGGNVLEAEDGDEGLRLARKHRPDLILMDLSMPVMDGWEAMRRLEWDPVTSGIPVLAVTAHRLPADRVEEAGFCGYLEKPISPHHVLEEVEQCIGALHRDDEHARESRSPAKVSLPSATGSAARDPGAVPGERAAGRRRPVRPRRTAASGARAV